jgi:hypothetical protein
LQTEFSWGCELQTRNSYWFYSDLMPKTNFSCKLNLVGVASCKLATAIATTAFATAISAIAVLLQWLF